MESADIDDSSFNVNSRKTNECNQPFLHRALSTVAANQALVENQRNILAENYRRTPINHEIVTIDHDDADASFILPNLFQLSEQIRPRILDNLLDLPTMKVLEETKRLNWWVKEKFFCPPLYPLMTTGDGNCLLHATSLAMWGFHDHALSMRKALHQTLITLKTNSALYRRWRWTQSIHNKTFKLVYSEEEWTEEWKYLLRLSSTKPRLSKRKISQSSQTNADDSTSELRRQCYESLEELHVYVLANNIRRPIIIYSETILRTYQGEALSPIEFGGIYLPLEIPPEKCCKQPIFLTFDAAHFSALVPMESSEQSRGTYRIPIIDLETLDLLPIHFLIDPGVNFQWPNNEELSDEKIRSYSNIQQNRMHILGQYLNLSKEYSPLNHFRSIEHENSSNKDVSIEKKSSRSSLNSLSKTIRRKLLHPFSSTKRFSLKSHHASLVDGNVVQQQTSSLYDSPSNILTIILVNFQPKRPEISDHMIQNYIETYTNEYHSKQMRRNHENLSNATRSSIYSQHNPTLILAEDMEKKEHSDDCKQLPTEMYSIHEQSNQRISGTDLHDRSASRVNSELMSSLSTNVDHANNYS